MVSRIKPKYIFLCLTLLIPALVAVLPEKATPKPMTWVLDYELAAGTQPMVELLAMINAWVAEQEVIRKSPSWKRQLANFFYESKASKMLTGVYNLQAGNTEKAVNTLSEISHLNWNTESSDAQLMRKINEWMAMSYLRQGEEQNCILDHNGASCVMPIQGTGIYELKAPTLKALEIYHFLLSLYPDNYRYRWLMNLAYQTLGEYPENVPQQWLINPKAFEDLDSLDNFRNIAPMLGVDHNSLAGGACLEDFDNDGYLDMMVSGRKQTQLTFYKNDGKGGFENHTEDAGLTGLTGGFNLFQADYNNDGYTDLFVARGAWLHNHGLTPNSLLKNNGDGTFSDVTVEAGVLSFKPTLNVVWADFNNDGWLDLFAGNETRGDKGDYSSEFYLNNQDGSFKEVSQEAGLGITTFVKGLAAADYNNDGWTDLFLSNKAGKNYLYKNLGPDQKGQLSFEDVAAQAGVANTDASFTSWFWDYDNDGDQDLYVSVYGPRDSNSVERVAKSYDGEKINSVWPAIFRNNGDGTFTNKAEELGMTFPLFTMGANYADFNNDGYLDIYLGTGEPNYMGIYPNRMFYSDYGEYFTDVTSEKGVGHIQKGHGVAIGDIDNDGDQDILAQMGGMLYGDTFQNALFQNPGEGDNNWINLRLEGVNANRSAIGTQVRISYSYEGKRKDIYRTISSGGSFGANSLQLEVGVGKATHIDSVQVKWQGSNEWQFFDGLAVNRTYALKEGGEFLISPSGQQPVPELNGQSLPTHEH
ncbi:MAG: CRTAC1 family protein [Cytophagales bacterium]|nr:CRTAC1 family protein [Cytophagales bacterium]